VIVFVKILINCTLTLMSFEYCPYVYVKFIFVKHQKNKIIYPLHNQICVILIFALKAL